MTATTNTTPRRAPMHEGRQPVPHRSPSDRETHARNGQWNYGMSPAELRAYLERNKSKGLRTHPAP